MRRTLLATLLTLPLLAACTAAPTPTPPRIVFFTADSAQLDGPAQAVVREVAAEIRSGGGSAVVRGFTGPAGSTEYNQSLSNTRALAVRDDLVAAGLPAERIVVQPRGPVPFEAVATESRRVEILVAR